MGLLRLACLVFFIGVCSADYPTTYVQPGSVTCDENGIGFLFNQDLVTSELFSETLLNFDLYTADQTVANEDFNRQTGAVLLPFTKYGVVATTIYGKDKTPLVYVIQQPFLAVPDDQLVDDKPVSPPPHVEPFFGFRNYTFSISCEVDASTEIHTVTNTSDGGHGDHSGEFVDAKEHISFDFIGLPESNVVELGNPLEFDFYLKDNLYSAMVPLACRFFDTNNPSKSVDFVNERCPVDNKDYGISKMKRVSASKYELAFNAFAFDVHATESLTLQCDISLCFGDDISSCDRPCWIWDRPVTESTTSAQTTSPQTGTTDTQPTQPTTEATTATTSVETAPTTGSTEPTEQTETTATVPTEATTEPPVPPVRRVRHVRHRRGVSLRKKRAAGGATVTASFPFKVRGPDSGASTVSSSLLGLLTTFLLAFSLWH